MQIHHMYKDEKKNIGILSENKTRNQMTRLADHKIVRINHLTLKQNFQPNLLAYRNMQS